MQRGGHGGPPHRLGNHPAHPGGRVAAFLRLGTNTSINRGYLLAQAAGAESRHPDRLLFAVPADKILDGARRLIDQGEQEGKLTPTQVLISRIYLILDDAAPEQIKKQSQMLGQLMSTQPNNFIVWLGENFFFAKGRYRPAVECFKHQLELDPTNTAARLDLARAYFHLRMGRGRARGRIFVTKQRRSQLERSLDRAKLLTCWVLACTTQLMLKQELSAASAVLC